jgi:hypothetical protein
VLPLLDPPSITRDERGVVSFGNLFPGSKVDVTVNGVTTKVGKGNTLFLPGTAEISATQTSSTGLRSEPTELKVSTVVPVERIHVSSQQLSTDSEEPGDGEVVNVMDGNVDTYWHTTWSQKEDEYPHWVAIKFPNQESIRKVRFLQRQNQENGRISRAAIETKVGDKWVSVHEITLRNTTDWIEVQLETPIVTNEIRVVAISEVGGHNWASLAEVEIYRDFKLMRDSQ